MGVGAGEALMRLVADKLAVARGNRTILAGLSFELEAGDSLVLTGPNGAGKTTLIRTLAGLCPRAAGALWLDGGEPAQSLGEASHYVGHLNAIKSILTVAENVGFWSRFCGGVAPQRDAALAAFGLSQLADIPAAYLSAGQKRRLGPPPLLLAPRPLWPLHETTPPPSAGRPGGRWPGGSPAPLPGAVWWWRPRTSRCPGAISANCGSSRRRLAHERVLAAARPRRFDRMEGRRQHWHCARLLSRGRGAAPIGTGARSQFAGADRAGGALDRAAAVGAAVARAPV